MSKVLLVDDDAQTRQFLKMQFQDSGYQVSEAANDREALTQAASEMPDLIVMDMNMPVMTGWDAAKELKKDGAPIIALTAQKTHDEQVAAHEAGCDTFVEKPIDPARLLEAVKRVLG